MRVLTICLLLCGVAVARATTLSTPLVLNAGLAGTGVACTFVNVSSMALTVTVSLLDSDGHVLETSCGPIPPQTGGWINPGSAPLSSNEVWCSFSFYGPARALRAMMELYDVPEVPRAFVPAT